MARNNDVLPTLGLLLSLMVYACPLRADDLSSWPIAELAKSSEELQRLRARHGGLVGTVSTRRMRRLYAIQQSISRAAELNPEFLLVRGDRPNAMAGYRDGIPTIMINLPMLDLIGDNVHQWSALIGHEIAHLKLEHIDASRKRSVPLTIARTVAGVLAPGIAGQVASNLIITGIDTKFGRDAERDADYMGVIWAAQAGYDPFGAADLHAAMHAKSSSLSLPFLSSHPSGPERIETLRALAERLAPRDERTTSAPPSHQ